MIWQSHSWEYKPGQNYNSQRYVHSMFITALFTIAKTWNNKGPSADEWIKKMWHIYIYNEILLGHKKEWNNAIYNNMDANGDYQY